jgi:pyrimidine operon attenuation protein/uracil phosphoribosyltransferase
MINGRYKYSLETDNSRVLRGSSTYYYYLAHRNRQDKNGVDNETAREWNKNNIEFLDKASDALECPLEYSSSDAKLLLGIMDNLRNLSLVTVNSAIMRRYMDRTVYVALNTYQDDPDIKDSHEICRDVYEVMSDICFRRPLDEGTAERMREIISDLKRVYGRVFEDVVSQHNPKLNAKSFRDNREIDSFIENYTTMKFAMNQLIEQNPGIDRKDIYYSGICYGGLEIPFLAEHVFDRNYYNVQPALITLQGDYYSRHQMGSVESESNILVKGIGNTDNDHSIVGDDLLSTGATVQTALNVLFENDYKVDNLMFVRYPTLNRVPQMLMPGHGSVDTRQFFSYIHGLLFASPYSKIKRGSDYRDELRVFDKNENRVLRMAGKKR